MGHLLTERHNCATHVTQVIRQSAVTLERILRNAENYLRVLSLVIMNSATYHRLLLNCSTGSENCDTILC
ncbi:hypothetical protein EG68_03196 [Paragonimus skrjabini miyazakii]|uniref:Uncharacterized protein n=1 Tax=Paragonimus skrjabini miyazakii TaxID=59628 RepID=A0A8S9YX79_9TREM|nr:hypothetical protein EG68_03196 [Paragonimus skrjabini miyazakii]